jgi:hypothetical protein
MCEILEDPFKIKQFHLIEYDCTYDTTSTIPGISMNPFLPLLRIPSDKGIDNRARYLSTPEAR